MFVCVTEKMTIIVCLSVYTCTMNIFMKFNGCMRARVGVGGVRLEFAPSARESIVAQCLLKAVGKSFCSEARFRSFGLLWC